MLARNKIFWHSGPAGGNPSGIGTAYRQLNAAGIRIFHKTVDEYGILQEIHKEIDPQDINKHVLVFRLSDRDDVYTFDTPLYHHPDYINNPEGAADIHWQLTLQYLPPEFNKERVWLELTNEVDREKCEWLGRFALHIAKKANSLGYKVALLGWASGEPEPVGWEEPSMLEFLRYCADNPTKCAVGLHEYSYIIDPIDHEFPFKVGRFQYLFATCDKHKIGRPTTLITEWGWTLDSVPDPTKAIQDIEKANKLYAPYPNILGAAIWYLGPGFGDIANKAQKLIQPLTDWTLNNWIEYNEQDIPQLPVIGDWIQYNEEEEEEMVVKRGAHVPFLAEMKGKKVVLQERKWNQATQGFDLVKQHAEIDLSDETTVLFVHVEGAESSPPQLKINDKDLGVDASYWQL